MGSSLPTISLDLVLYTSQSFAIFVVHLFKQMARILAIDYGTKRVGLAVTDPLQLIATGLDTVHSLDLFSFIKEYMKTEELERIVIGMPKNLNNEATHSTPHVVGVVRKLKKEFPTLAITEVDERFTSKLAFNTMIASGVNKKKRAEKGVIDKLSATIILQSYLEQISL